ncbi:MAG: malto-oligosyltrehalose synthase, partial [Candidatus Nanopelagicales bacterium]
QKDEFCRRFQQTSGPAIAKGVEDTACYRWFPLSALNEVGGDPDQFGISPAEFHEWAERRRADWPYSLNAMSTHDNKRSEDVRARLAVLSEIPGEWVTTVRAWRQASGPILTVGPDPALDNAATSDERLGWLAWQTLVGAWPLDAERLAGYLVKAAREAKLVTSWKSPDEGVEADIVAFVDRVLADEPLMGSVAQAVERLHPGFVANVLGQRAVQLFMPGVPDIYQGCEIVDLHLVDPDNRRCSDAVVLDEALVRGIAGVREPAVDLDAAKARLTATGLQVLRDRPDLVGPDAAHTAVGVEGQGADHVVAFTRGSDVVVLVTRFALRLAASGGWADTTVALPAGRWRELLQPRTMEFMEPSTPVADVLDHWPVAVLVREGA